MRAWVLAAALLWLVGCQPVTVATDVYFYDDQNRRVGKAEVRVVIIGGELPGVTFRDEGLRPVMEVW